MLAQQGGGGADEEFSRDQVGELGEKDDHRAALELRRECRQRESVVRLLTAVVDLRGHPLELAEGARPGDEAAGQPRPRIERVERHPVTEFERDPDVEQHRRNRAVDPRQAGNRIAHLPPGIDREDDLLIALHPMFLGVKLDVPRGLLPVDRPPVHARAVFDERFELAALAAEHLGQQAL